MITIIIYNIIPIATPLISHKPLCEMYYRTSQRMTRCVAG